MESHTTKCSLDKVGGDRLHLFLIPSLRRTRISRCLCDLSGRVSLERKDGPGTEGKSRTREGTEDQVSCFTP